MANELLGEWAPFVFPAAAFLYLLILRNVDKRVARKRPLSVEELLTKLARTTEHNEYDLFCLSGEEWNIMKPQIEKDFKTYLLQGDIPYYVNHYIRKIQKDSGNAYQPPFLLGGGYMPWLK